MELLRIILCCCLITILITDVVVSSPLRRARDIAEAERLENAIEEGLSIYRAEKRTHRRRHRRRTNRMIERMRVCRNYRHYPIERMPAHCRELVFRHGGRRHNSNNPTIVIIEK